MSLTADFKETLAKSLDNAEENLAATLQHVHSGRIAHPDSIEAAARFFEDFAKKVRAGEITISEISEQYGTEEDAMASLRPSGVGMFSALFVSREVLQTRQDDAS